MYYYGILNSYWLSVKAHWYAYVIRLSDIGWQSDLATVICCACVHAFPSYYLIYYDRDAKLLKGIVSIYKT